MDDGDGWMKAEGQKSEVRGQRSEVRGQRSEVRKTVTMNP